MSETITAGVVESMVPVAGPSVASGASEAEVGSGVIVSPSVTPAAEQAAMDEESERREANKVLKECTKCYARGERSYRAGLLESGLLAHDYIVRRMTLGDTRGVAVDTVRGELSRYASGKVDVNRLIACSMAHKLLATDTGLGDNVGSMPYGHYKAAWSLLVDRTGYGKAETWVLLPGFEQQCKELYVKAVETELSREGCETQAKAVISEYSRAQQAKLAVEAEEAKKAAEAAQAASAAERAKAEELVKAQQAKAAEVLAAPSDEAKSALMADLAAAEDAVKRQQQATLEAVNTEAKAVKQAVTVEKEHKAVVQAVERAAERELKAAERAASKVKPAVPAVEGRLPNLLAAGQKATVKDAAEFCVNLLAGHETPDDVLAELCRQLKRRDDMSRVCKRACDAALVVLSTPNGVVAAA